MAPAMSALQLYKRRTRRLTLLCVVTAVVLSASTTALAQEAASPGAVETAERLRSVAEARVRSELPPSAEVNADALDARLRLPACTALAADPPNGRGATLNVALRCTAPTNWTVYVPVRVRDPRPVYVLTAATRRGDAVTPAVLRVETRDIAQLPFGYIAADSPLDELEFRRGLAPGAALAPTDVGPRRCIRRGEQVQLVRRIGGLEVRADGKALADAARGERVRVENSNSKRIVEGRASAPGVVEL